MGIIYNSGTSGKLVVLFSGGASSFKAMMDDPNRGKLYDVVFGLTNVADASGRGSFIEAGIEHGLLDPENYPTREAFYEDVMGVLKDMKADAIALSGWLNKYSLIKGEILEEYRNRIFNVHPAKLHLLTGPWCGRVDVSGMPSPVAARFIEENELTRKYTGDDAVYDAVILGETSVASTVFAIDEGEDTGTILVESRDFEVKPEITKVWVPQVWERDKKAERVVRDYVDNKLQDDMKWKGDGPAFLKTLELYFTGSLEIGDVEEGAKLLNPETNTLEPLPYRGLKPVS